MKLSILAFFLTCFLSLDAQTTYEHSPYNSFVCGSVYDSGGNGLKMAVSTSRSSGNKMVFGIAKHHRNASCSSTDVSSFSSSGRMELREGSTSGPVVASQSFSSGGKVVYLTYYLPSTFTNGSKRYYVTLNSSGFIYRTGAITITATTSYDISVSEPRNNYGYPKRTASGSANSLPIRWTKNFSGNVSIELYTSSGSKVATIRDNYSGSSFNYSIPSSLSTGSYKIKMYPTGTTGYPFWSSTFKIFDQPLLSSPNNNYQYSAPPSSITFRWSKNNLSGLANYEFRLRDVTENRVLRDYVNAGDASSYTYNYSFKAGHQYAWVVRAKSGSNAATSESASRNFSIKDEPSVFNLSLSRAMSLGTTNLEVGKSYNFSTIIQNTGNANWTGSLYLKVNNQSSSIDMGGYTVGANSTRTINFTYHPTSSHVGSSVSVELLYQTNGTGSGIRIPRGSYTNPISVNISQPANGSNLVLAASTTVLPNPVIKGEAATFRAQVRNNNATTWTGQLQFNLLNSSGVTINVLNSPQNVNIGAGNSYTMTHTSSAISTNAGNYQVEVIYIDSGSSAQRVNRGSYSNPQSFSIQNPTTPTPNLSLGATMSLGSNSLRAGNNYNFATIIKNTGTANWIGSVYLRINNQAAIDLGSYTVTAGNQTDIVKSYTLNSTHVGTNVPFELLYQTNGSGSGIRVPRGSYTNPVSATVGNTIVTTNLALANKISITPSPVVRTKSARFSTYVRNDDSKDWTGRIEFQLLNSSGTPINVINSWTTTILRNDSKSFSHTSNAVSTSAGNYRLRVVYYNQGNNSNTPDGIVKSGSYTNPESFSIQNPYSSPNLSLSSSIYISPSSPIHGQSATFRATVRNNSATPYAGKVYLQLLNSYGGYITDLDEVNGVSGSGTATLELKTNALSSAKGDYKIRVAYQDGNQYPTVNGNGNANPRNFSIQPNSQGVITVTSPTNQTYNIGQNLPIRWKSTNIAGNLTIRMVQASNNAFAKLITSETANNGKKDWLIGDIQTGTYKIQIYEKGTAKGLTYSEPFVIGTATRSIAISQPSSGTRYNVGQNVSVRWTSQGITGNLGVLLLRENGSIEKEVTSNLSNTSTSTQFSLSSDIPTGNYKVKVYQLDTDVSAISGNITITNTSQVPSFRVIHYYNLASSYGQLGGSQELSRFSTNSNESSSNIFKVCADGSQVSTFRIEGINNADISHLSYSIVEATTADIYGRFVQTNYSNSVITLDYTHPTSIGDITGKVRTLRFQIRDNNRGVTIKQLDIEVYRPPVIMAHGLWGNIKSFKKMKEELSKTGKFVHLSRVDYKETNDASFATNAGVIPLHINNTFQEMSNEKIAVGKVDVIGHSMGGIVSRMYIQGENYRKDINKLITIQTPHSGSQFANVAQDPSLKTELISRSVLYGLGYDLFAGAVRDLAVDSEAIKTLNAKDARLKNLVPTHTITTFFNDPDDEGDQDLQITGNSLSRLIGKKDVIEVFNGELNDGIVAKSSQQAGLINNTTYQIPEEQHHLGGPSNGLVINKVKELLNKDVNSGYYDLDGLEPPTLTYTTPSLQTNTIEDFNSLTLKINQPTNGQTISIGESLAITATVSGNVSKIKAVVEYDDEEILYGLKHNQSNVSFSYTIEEKMIGQRKIYIIAEDANNNSIIDSVYINIQNDNSPDELIFEEDEINMYKGEIKALSIQAAYTNGSTFTITDTENLSIDLSNNNVISENKQLHAMEEGYSNMTVTYRGIQSRPIPITVETTANCFFSNNQKIFDAEPSSGEYYSSVLMESNAMVKVNRDVTFIAGKSIKLQPGFTVQAGGQFLGKIEACENAPDPCDLDLSPVIEFDRKVDYTTTSGDLRTAFYIPVTNWPSFPEGMFLDAPFLPECGSFGLGSRTYINIHDAATGRIFFRFCGVNDPSVLPYLYFTRTRTSCITSVYMSLEDRECEVFYVSNTLNIDCSAGFGEDGIVNDSTDKIEDLIVLSDLTAPNIGGRILTEINDASLAVDYISVKEKSNKVQALSLAGIVEKNRQESHSFSCQLAPNPTTSITTLSIQQTGVTPIWIELRTITGQLLKTPLSNRELPVGNHTFELDMSNYPHGVYYVNVRSNKKQVTKRLILIK